MDLIYGIPGQTINSWRNTISKTIECSPTHVSTYELTPEENTPLFGLIRSGEIAMLDEESVLEMYHHAIDSLAKCGYEQEGDHSELAVSSACADFTTDRRSYNRIYSGLFCLARVT